MRTAFKSVHSKDPDFQSFQDNLKDFFAQFKSWLTVDGAFVTVAITTSFQNVPHPLGRVPQGFQIVDADADTRVWRDPVTTNNPDVTKFLRLKGASAANVKLWVF